MILTGKKIYSKKARGWLSREFSKEDSEMAKILLDEDPKKSLKESLENLAITFRQKIVFKARETVLRRTKGYRLL